jgi:hypothetical protein
MVSLYLHWETRNNFQVNGILLLLTLVKLARKTIAHLHSSFAFQFHHEKSLNGRYKAFTVPYYL